MKKSLLIQKWMDEYHIKKAMTMAYTAEDTDQASKQISFPLVTSLSGQPMTTPTPQQSFAMHPKVTMDYICRRKLDDTLFCSSSSMPIESIHGVLCTRAGVMKHKEEKFLLSGVDAVKDLKEFLYANQYKPYELKDSEYSETFYLFDDNLEAFSSIVNVALNEDDFGYRKVRLEGIRSHEAVDMANAWLNERASKPRFFQVNECTLDGDKDVHIEENTLETDKVQTALDVFYPFLEGGIDHVLQCYVESKAPVLILLGPPGTGKSTFMRTLLAKYADVAFLTYDTECAKHPGFLMDYYGTKKANFAVLEDIDVLLLDRSRENKFMSTLLNRTEGLIKHKNKKIVLSTNLPSNSSIDEALMRTGRCHDLITFRNLTPVEAANVAKAMDLPECDYTTRNEWSLSDVLNPSQSNLERARKHSKLGF